MALEDMSVLGEFFEFQNFEKKIFKTLSTSNLFESF